MTPVEDPGKGMTMLLKGITKSQRHLGDKPESVMKEFIEFIVKHLVEDPDRVKVTEEKNEKGLLFKLKVGESDIGRVVGKEGRTARSLRTLLNATAARRGQRANLEIIDGSSETTKS